MFVQCKPVHLKCSNQEQMARAEGTDIHLFKSEKNMETAAQASNSNRTDKSNLQATNFHLSISGFHPTYS